MQKKEQEIKIEEILATTFLLFPVVTITWRQNKHN